MSLQNRVRHRWQRRVRPIAAGRAMRRVLANPDDTGKVFEVIRALSGRSFERLLRRVRADATGARVLAERRDLIPVLSDTARLRALPEDTLGHQYARFVEREQISADGLVAASEEPSALAAPAGLEDDPEATAFGARLRDMHDLWHVVTGYNRDILGELALLAFTYEQTRNRGIGFIVRTAERRIRRGGNSEIGRFLARARDRGRNAALLPAADWERLLGEPLEAVRRELRVGATVAYEEHRSAAGEAAVAAGA